jgi:hypothetical protein
LLTTNHWQLIQGGLVRKFLGVLVAAAALSAISWAQAASQAPAGDSTSSQAPSSAQQPTPADTQAPAPDQAPSASIPSPGKQNASKFPRTELFGGYSFAQAGFFNAGHWAQLNGWNASFTINADKMVGFIIDVREHFGNSQIPGAVPAPFPVSDSPYCSSSPVCTFNANTREFQFLFGPNFAYRKYERLTPFANIMVGHASIRGQADGADDVLQSEVSGGLAFTGGGGVDRKINERFALRIKADFLETRTSFPTIGKNHHQENLLLSVGVVIRSVHKKKRTLEEETGVE